MEFVRGPLARPTAGLAEVKLHVDRQTLAKRRWRGAAEDGHDFGFDLEQPLRHGDIFLQTNSHSYVVAQAPEPVLIVMIVTPAQAARIAWQVGNLHFPLSVREDAILVEDDVALRQMFTRENISFRVSQEIYQPLNAAAGHHHH